MRLIDLYIGRSPGLGRGVFSRNAILAGEVIEVCPVILVPTSELIHLDKTVVYNYYFVWNNEHVAVALGYGSIYNHNKKPNAIFEYQFISNEIIFKATRTIPANSEIFVDYTAGTGKVWWDKG